MSEENIKKFIPGVHYDVEEMTVSFRHNINHGNYENTTVERCVKIKSKLSPEQSTKANILLMLHDVGRLMRKSVWHELSTVTDILKGDKPENA